MSPVVMTVVVTTMFIVLLAIGAIVAARNFVRVEAGRALVVHTTRGDPRVIFDGGTLVLPVLHRADVIDLTLKQFVISRRGKDGAHFNDGIRADISMTFGVRVNRTADDVLRVVRSIGAKRASESATLEDLFTAKFSEAIKIVLGAVPFESSVGDRERIRDQIIAVIGRDLNGFVLDDASIDFLEQTPIEALDPSNIIDAKGMKKIKSMSIEPPASPISRVERWSTELERNGLRDVRVTVEISCDIVEREPMRVALRDATEVLSGRVATSVLAAAGDGELRCENGQATLRWNQTDVTADELVAGAKIVLALRTDPSGYR